MNEEQREEHSRKLQLEVLDNKDNNVRVVNRWEIEIFQKLPIGITHPVWTDEDKKAIGFYTNAIHEKVHEYINSLLDEDNNLGLLEFVSSTRDIKIDISKSVAKGLLKEVVEQL